MCVCFFLQSLWWSQPYSHKTTMKLVNHLLSLLQEPVYINVPFINFGLFTNLSIYHFIVFAKALYCHHHTIELLYTGFFIVPFSVDGFPSSPFSLQFYSCLVFALRHLLAVKEFGWLILETAIKTCIINRCKRHETHHTQSNINIYEHQL